MRTWITAFFAVANGAQAIAQAGYSVWHPMLSAFCCGLLVMVVAIDLVEWSGARSAQRARRKDREAGRDAV